MVFFALHVGPHVGEYRRRDSLGGQKSLVCLRSGGHHWRLSPSGALGLHLLPTQKSYEKYDVSRQSIDVTFAASKHFRRGGCGGGDRRPMVAL